jgi:uncharacterized protein YndB with AHSA1/START domain
MARGLTARASVVVQAGEAAVWEALVTPEQIRRYMLGATVESEWREGARIVWRGEWQGKAYEDHGTILRLDPPRLLEYSHFSPLSGLPDTPENHHTVTIELRGDGRSTHVTLSQDNNPTESARQHSEKNWGAMLAGLKGVVEDEVRRRDADVEGPPAPS